MIFETKVNLTRFAVNIVAKHKEGVPAPSNIRVTTTMQVLIDPNKMNVYDISKIHQLIMDDAKKTDLPSLEIIGINQCMMVAEQEKIAFEPGTLQSERGWLYIPHFCAIPSTDKAAEEIGMIKGANVVRGTLPLVMHSEYLDDYELIVDAVREAIDADNAKLRGLTSVLQAGKTIWVL